MLSVNVQHTERNALLYMAYTSGAEVSGHFGTGGTII